MTPLHNRYRLCTLKIGRSFKFKVGDFLQLKPAIPRSSSMNSKFLTPGILIYSLYLS